jgi:hypothetical protein
MIGGSVQDDHGDDEQDDRHAVVHERFDPVDEDERPVLAF